MNSLQPQQQRQPGLPRQPKQSGEPVVLVVPPVLHPMIPPLGASSLAASCKAGGVPARVVEANLAFAGRVGFHACGLVAASPPYRLLGEALFLAAAFPERRVDHDAILQRLRKAEGPGTVAMRWQAAQVSDEIVERCLSEIPGFVADVAGQIVASQPRIVGMSSMGQQTLASIALAREIKRLDPAIVTVIGGSNATDPMAAGILATTEVLDFAFSGESDSEFPQFCRNYIERDELPAQRVIRCRPVTDLDNIPDPDYDAYFEALGPLRITEPLARWAPDSLLFESSRGCWWGDKHLCKFCGYIPPSVGRYRVRSAERIAGAITNLVDRYGVDHIRASDAIMPLQFPKTVLPKLIERGVECTLAYEIKSNHREDDLDTFVRAGIKELQPGIESLSSPVLKAMDKGVTALDNVRLLRNARSRSIHIIWNFLSAIPGETSADYEAMIELMPLIEHLNAPVRFGPIHVSRYSPYQQEPEQYGISNLRPMPVYVELFGAQAAKVCSNFEADYDTEAMRNQQLTTRFERVVAAWCDAWERDEAAPCLELHSLEHGRALIQDTRAIAAQEWQRLEPPAVAALSAVHNPIRADQLEPELRAAMETLLQRQLVVLYEDRLMSLVTKPILGFRLMAERHERLAGQQRRRPSPRSQAAQVEPA